MRWVKAKCGKIDYGYLLEITSHEGVILYNVTRGQDRIDKGLLDGLHHDNSLRGHPSTSIGMAIRNATTVRGTSFIDEACRLVSSIGEGMLHCVDKYGGIYLQECGSYMPITEDSGMEISTPVKYDANVAWPRDQYTISDIKVQKWPGGSHWYATVGSQEVSVGGLTKWVRKGDAERHALDFLEELRSQISPPEESDGSINA